MYLTYRKIDPTGNITGLVENPVDESLRAFAARPLMQAEPDMEQVGFVSPCGEADIRLDMAGGEFCGNASLSAAALWLSRHGGESARVRVSVSGAENAVSAFVRKTGDNCYAGTVDMPLPLSAEMRELPVPGGGLCLPVVRFPGISHVIAPGDMSPAQAEAVIAYWCEVLGAEALGIMLWSPEGESLRPLVWVPGAETLCWERSCASGSSAVGAWAALSSGAGVSLSLKQSGGTLGVEAEISGGRIRSLRLSGQVRLGDTKTLEII